MKHIGIFMLLLVLCSLNAQRVWDASASRKYNRPLPNQEFYRWENCRADSAHGFDVQKYEITLTITQSPNTINGNVLATVLATENLQSISYELVGLTVNQVKVNGVNTAYTHSGGFLNIPVNAAIGDTFTTQVFYGGTPQLSPNIYGIGMYFQTNSIFTVSDPDAGRYWWPCYDHPWDKAVVDLRITMRSDWKVAANGIRQSITNNGNGTSTTVWLGEHPMTTYLVCITAGPYVEINQTALEGTLPVQNFVTQSQYNNAVIDLQSLPNMIDYYSQLFGTYPFEKYGNATVSMSTFAAMEHQTMTTLGNYLITGNLTHELTIAHELVHQWFGNAVSFLDFKDVWLSEGFATYGEHLWVDRVAGWQAACDYVQSSYHQYYTSWENSNGAARIYNPNFNNYFSPPSYEKAASVLHMLRLKIGNDNFFQLLRQWFDTYKHSNVITSEFQALAESISGMDLNQFFQQWIFGTGLPSLQYTMLESDTPGEMTKVIAKSTSPTSTSFFLEVPFRVTSSTGIDSLYVIADPIGYVNVFENIHGITNIIPNYRNWTLLRQITQVKPQLNTCLPSHNSVYVSWQPFTFAGFCTYQVYRRTGNGDWQALAQNAISVTGFTDNTVTNGIAYEYMVKAIDSEGYVSIGSNTMSATPVEFSFENYMLVVDETKNGSGISINPDDAMVDAFYDYAIAPLPYTQWDVDLQGLPSLSDLGQYKIVLWHADDFSQQLLVDCEQRLGGYMIGGGKLLISGWKATSALPISFWDNYMGHVSLYYDNAASLMSVSSDQYPTLTPNPDKLVAAWNGMLPMIHTYGGDITSLYTANMTESSAGNGRSAAFQSNNLWFFGFPLYFMQETGVRDLLQQLLPSIYPVSTQDETIPASAQKLSCFPNPFNPQTQVLFTVPFSGQVKMNLYNTKGQQVLELENAYYTSGSHALTLDAGKLSSGIYLLRMQTEFGTTSKRITLMK